MESLYAVLAIIGGSLIGVPSGIWIMHKHWHRTFDGKTKGRY